MSTASQDIIASHKAAASRASTWLREHRALSLKPTESLELVAQVLGAPNWQTLHGQAKRGQGPRVDASAGLPAPPSEPTHLFEAAFATGHAPTDKRNFAKRDGRYVEPRIDALYEGFVKGLACGPSAGSKPATAAPSGSASRFASALVAPPTLESAAPAAGPKHSFKAGDDIEVENGRSETLYRGKVLDVDGNKVRVKLPAANDRPFIFDLDDSWVECKDGVIFTSW